MSYSRHRYAAFFSGVPLILAGALHAQSLFAPNSALGTSINTNVGVGTTTPGAKLEVVGSIRATSTTVLPTTGTGVELFYQPTPRLGVLQTVDRSNSAHVPMRLGPALHLDPSGLVGIGTDTPGANLDVSGTIRAGGLRPITLNSGTGVIVGQGDSGGWAFGYHAQGAGGTNRGGFGFYGCGDDLWRYYIGESYDNASFVVSASGNVGVGTMNPVQKMDIEGGYLRVGHTSGPFIDLFHSAAPAGQKIARIGQVNGDIYIDVVNDSYSQNTPRIFVQNTSGNVGIGTTNPTHKLSVSGTIRAKEVIVETTGWSDYVFEKDYALAPLSAIEEHIREHKTLPGIPSASEVAAEGIGVGEMQAKLLAKVEELTLHLISQEKKIVELQAKNEALQSQVSELQRR